MTKKIIINGVIKFFFFITLCTAVKEIFFPELFTSILLLAYWEKVQRSLKTKEKMTIFVITTATTTRLFVRFDSLFVITSVFYV